MRSSVLPARLGHRIIAVLATVYLGVQIITPATYHLRDEKSDERFAWRMFSARNMLLRCLPEYSEGRAGDKGLAWTGRDLEAHFRPIWLRLLRQGNARVAQAVLRERCGVVAGLAATRLRLPCFDKARGRSSSREFTASCVSGPVRR